MSLIERLKGGVIWRKTEVGVDWAATNALLSEAAERIVSLEGSDLEAYHQRRCAVEWFDKFQAAEANAANLTEALEAVDSEVLLTGNLKDIVDAALAGDVSGAQEPSRAQLSVEGPGNSSSTPTEQEQ